MPNPFGNNTPKPLGRKFSETEIKERLTELSNNFSNEKTHKPSQLTIAANGIKKITGIPYVLGSRAVNLTKKVFSKKETKAPLVVRNFETVLKKKTDRVI